MSIVNQMRFYDEEAARFWNGKTRDEIMNIIQESLGRDVLHNLVIICEAVNQMTGVMMTYMPDRPALAMPVKMIYHVYQVFGFDSVITEEDFRLHFDMIQALMLSVWNPNNELSNDDPLTIPAMITKEYVFGDQDENYPD